MYRLLLIVGVEPEIAYRFAIVEKSPTWAFLTHCSRLWVRLLSCDEKDVNAQLHFCFEACK